MKKQTNNGLSQWIRPEHLPFRSILLFGWLALVVLAIAYVTGWIRDGSRTDRIILIILLAMTLLYLLFTFRLLRSSRVSQQQWERLSKKQQDEMHALLATQEDNNIHYNHILPLSEFLCVYSKQQPAILFHQEIAWVYTLKGKLPRSATTYVPSHFKVTNVDNYLVFYNQEGKKFICYFGNRTLELYQHLMTKTPDAIHGYSEEKQRQFAARKK